MLRGMKAVVIRYTTRVAGAHAPLRRSLPARASRASTRRREWPTPLLALAGVVLFVEIEFALAFVLHAASRLVG